MILDILDFLNEIAVELEKFMDKYHDNPFFWLILFFILFLLASMAISKFANK